MKHPRLGSSKRIAATVQALCDGINVGTDPTLIGDRQCADSENVWWERGALRCREGFTTNLKSLMWSSIDDTTRYLTDADGWLLALQAGNYESGADVRLSAFDTEGHAFSWMWYRNGNIGLDGFLAPVGGDLRHRFSALLFLNDGTIIGAKASQNRFEDITEEVYVPLRMSNATPVKTRNETTLTGDLLEGNNLLTMQFRATFTTDGEGLYYYLPPLYSRSSLEVTVQRNGTETRWSIIGGGQTSEEIDGLRLHLNTTNHCFWFTQNGEVHPLPAGDIRNNLTAVADCDNQAVALPYTMRFATWFGGDRGAVIGGTRLFLGGSNDGSIVWSDLNNPLYFPESNIAVVGTPNQPLTAFGKQGSLLILFKEHELYAAEYEATSAVTAEQVTAGEVTDITATAVFPLTPLHAEIGCDLPKTVALCGNRLWWACRDGSVYALQSTGQLSQRCVARLSQPIEPLLRQNGAPSFAAAAVWDGHYYLLWNDTVWTATDEQTPAFYRFSTAGTHAQPVTLLVRNGVLELPSSYRAGSSSATVLYTLKGQYDTRLSHVGSNWADAVLTASPVPIRGMVCTKHYDFGTPERHKTVYRVFAEARAEGKVALSYVTEHGEVKDLPHPSRAVEGLHATPNGLRVRRLGIRLAGEQLCLNSVTMHLKE